MAEAASGFEKETASSRLFLSPSSPPPSSPSVWESRAPSHPEVSLDHDLLLSCLSFLSLLLPLTLDHTGDIPAWFLSVVVTDVGFFSDTSLLSFGNEAACVWQATR